MHVVLIGMQMIARPHVLYYKIQSNPVTSQLHPLSTKPLVQNTTLSFDGIITELYRWRVAKMELTCIFILQKLPTHPSSESMSVQLVLLKGFKVLPETEDVRS